MRLRSLFVPAEKITFAYQQVRVWLISPVPRLWCAGSTPMHNIQLYFKLYNTFLIAKEYSVAIHEYFDSINKNLQEVLAKLNLLSLHMRTRLSHPWPNHPDSLDESSLNLFSAVSSSIDSCA